MSKPTIKERIEAVVFTLKRIKNERPQEYQEKLKLYLDMRDGGDGGNFRSTDKKMRDLHFKNWKDSDFQFWLEKLGETPVLSEEEKRERFPEEYACFFSRIKKVFF